VVRHGCAKPRKSPAVLQHGCAELRKCPAALQYGCRNSGKFPAVLQHGCRNFFVIAKPAGVKQSMFCFSGLLQQQVASQ
jgi:hypothetical protein